MALRPLAATVVMEHTSYFGHHVTQWGQIYFERARIIKFFFFSIFTGKFLWVIFGWYETCKLLLQNIEEKNPNKGEFVEKHQCRIFFLYSAILKFRYWTFLGIQYNTSIRYSIQLVFKATLCITLTIFVHKILSGSLFLTEKKSSIYKSFNFFHSNFLVWTSGSQTALL